MTRTPKDAAKFDIWIHHHGGRGPVCVDTVTGTLKGEAKQAALDSAKVWYPHHTTSWDNDRALLVKDSTGAVVATISIDPPSQPYTPPESA